MSNIWRYPAALLVVAGIGFPALATAASGSGAHARRSGPAPRLRPAAGVANARDAGDVLTRPQRQLHDTINAQLHEIRAEQRRNRRQRFPDLPGGVSRATLDAIGQCESGADPHAVSADGTYRGKYQFDYGSWASVGGHGDPAQAPEREQDYRAALLYERAGSSPWPICG